MNSFGKPEPIQNRDCPNYNPTDVNFHSQIANSMLTAKFERESLTCPNGRTRPVPLEWRHLAMSAAVIIGRTGNVMSGANSERRTDLEPGPAHRTSADALHTELQGPAIMNRCEPSWSPRNILYEASFGDSKAAGDVQQLRHSSAYIVPEYTSGICMTIDYVFLAPFHRWCLSYFEALLFGSHIHCLYVYCVGTYFNFFETDALCQTDFISFAYMIHTRIKKSFLFALPVSLLVQEALFARQNRLQSKLIWGKSHCITVT